MKINKVTDVEGLFQVVEECKGEVELITGEGDRLNLKSKLCQIISLSSIFPMMSEIPNLEIVAHEPEDMEKIASFLFQ
ncbi:MAG: polya polymerase [Lachnospiraceae bacterium]|jgi:hypothetical protein|nr:polya polymerase [Lachnospiraceae bacterium]MDE6940979.1 polya polymerase [Lachnospiraceae bacterium]MDE6991399.1 polya polymerase [Lachnospiraceae bacterium]MDE6999101.1 polya polymerase [Lachnospiraceae bacterium]